MRGEKATGRITSETVRPLTEITHLVPKIKIKNSFMGREARGFDEN